MPQTSDGMRQALGKDVGGSRALIVAISSGMAACSFPSSWRGLRFTEFELRQLDAVRKELDADYETSIARSDRSSRPRVSSKSAP